MGDRGNVCIKQDNGGKVFFYTHWRGSELKDIVKAALAKRWRWTDECYLGRIIFCEMIKGQEAGETGFGISNAECDTGPLVVIDVKAQTVTMGKKVWTFEEFIA